MSVQFASDRLEQRPADVELASQNPADRGRWGDQQVPGGADLRLAWGGFLLSSPGGLRNRAEGDVAGVNEFIYTQYNNQPPLYNYCCPARSL